MSHPIWEYAPGKNRRREPAVYRAVGQPCFFTVRAARSYAPFARPELAEMAIHCLLEQQTKSGCRVDVYCLMPDHLHVIVTPVMEGASSLLFLARFKGWSSRLIHLAGWQGALWQPRSYDHVIRRDEDMHKIADYILANPVRKGICTEPDEYPLRGLPNEMP